MHAQGTIVYVGGITPATVTEPDSEGAIVREHDDNSEGWHPWSNLLSDPVCPECGRSDDCECDPGINPTVF